MGRRTRRRLNAGAGEEVDMTSKRTASSTSQPASDARTVKEVMARQPTYEIVLLESTQTDSTPVQNTQKDRQRRTRRRGRHKTTKENDSTRKKKKVEGRECKNEKDKRVRE